MKTYKQNWYLPYITWNIMINTETRHSPGVRVNLEWSHHNILSLMRIRNGKPHRLSTDPLGTNFLRICKENEWKCVKYRRVGSSVDSSRGALQSEEAESRRQVCLCPDAHIKAIVNTYESNCTLNRQWTTHEKPPAQMKDRRRVFVLARTQRKW